MKFPSPGTVCALFLLAAGAPVHAGSTLIKDIFEGSISGAPKSIINVDGTLYFQAQDIEASEELWRSDGTESGTFRIKDIYPGPIASRPDSFVVHQGELYFIAGGEDGDEIWKTDGTEAGTVQITDINPGAGDSVMRFFVVFDKDWQPAMISVGEWLYFVADDGETGFELWKTDGTGAGTTRVKDIFPGPGSGIEAPRFAALGDTVFFFAMDTLDNGIELWKSDGTEAGTMMVEAINDVPEDTAFPDPLDVDEILAATSTHVFFRGFDGTDFGLYASDGGNVMRLITTAPSGLASPNFLDSLNVWQDRLYCRAITDGNGAELWVSDGTPGGTKILRDFNPGGLSTVRNPTEMVASGPYLYFACDGGGFPGPGQELCLTDGTPGGTRFIRDIEPGSGFSSPREMVDVNGLLYFQARTTELGTELYRSDGTPEGTYLAADLVPGDRPANPVELTAFRRGLVYTYNDLTHGLELHRFCCDSTETQSIAVMDDTTGNGAPEIAAFAVTDSERMEIRVFDAKTGDRSVFKDNIFNSRWLENALLAVPGAGRSRGPALAVAASFEDGSAGIQLRDGATGAKLRNLTPRNDAWITVDTAAVPGIASRSAAAVATLSQRRDDDMPAIDVRDPIDDSRLASFQLLNPNWRGLAIESLSVHGSAAVAALATRRSDGRTRIHTRDALTGVELGNFTIGTDFRAIEFHAVPDMNGDGADEIATMLERSSDGLVVIQVREATTGELISKVYPIGRGKKDWRIAQFRPLTVNGVAAFAILGVNREDSRVLVQTRDAMTGEPLRKIAFNKAPWELQAEFAVIDDFSGNGEPELAVPMRNAENARRIVQVRDAADGSVIQTITLPK